MGLFSKQTPPYSPYANQQPTPQQAPPMPPPPPPPQAPPEQYQQQYNQAPPQLEKTKDGRVIYNPYFHLEKRIAAWEVLQKLKTVQTVSLIGISVAFLTAILGVFAGTTGSYGGIVLSFIFIYYVFVSKREMQRLKGNYNL